MNRFILVCLISSFCLSSFTFAQSPGKLEKIKNWVSKFLGGNQASDANADSIKLPKIPKIIQDPTSSDVFDWKDRDNQFLSKLSAEQKREELANFIYEVFKATRQGRPTDSERRQWINSLNQGATREGVYRALVKDDTYAGLENFDDPLKEEHKAFAVSFMQKYLNQKANTEALAQINSFSLKRILVEKSFEVIDALKSDGQKADDWYAFVSADLATVYGKHFESRLRKDSEAKIHKKWALKVSFDFLKVEMAIKIHHIINQI